MAIRTLKTGAALSEIEWEALYAPYDQATYQAVLDRLGPDDVILDIGAGDLRLSRQMAQLARKVYAVEIQGELLRQATPLPANLVPIHADARELSFPRDITTGVLLMRHCTCFGLYAARLQKAGADRLVTNARWRMAVEVVNLRVARKPFDSIGMGWYACLCGSTGFKEGPAEHWTSDMDGVVHEVSSCPECIET